MIPERILPHFQGPPRIAIALLFLQFETAELIVSLHVAMLCILQLSSLSSRMSSSAGALLISLIN
jgi:hypothetical protein